MNKIIERIITKQRVIVLFLFPYIFIGFLILIKKHENDYELLKKGITMGWCLH